ncbi:hypothetical protein [Urechidicola sp. KH5]
MEKYIGVPKYKRNYAKRGKNRNESSDLGIFKGSHLHKYTINNELLLSANEKAALLV